MGSRKRSYLEISLIKQKIEIDFRLAQSEGYDLVSPDTYYYNCIAWAAGDFRRVWWPKASPSPILLSSRFCFPTPPSYYWPSNAPQEETLDAFITAFESLRYSPCDTCVFEEGFEKVAIYIGGDSKPKHMSRQYESGIWSSKLGANVDIEHKTLKALEGSRYGSVIQILKREAVPESYLRPKENIF